MSTIISKNVQVGTSGTAAQNLTIYQPTSPDGTLRFGMGNAGATTSDVFQLGATGATLPLGTANGVAYLNGSKVLTTGSGLQFDGTNLGLGVTPSAWGGSYKAIQFASGAIAGFSTTALDIYGNAYDIGAGAWRYLNSSQGATRYAAFNGAHQWFTAPSGTAGNAITFTQAMTLDASGNLGVGETSPSSWGRIVAKLDQTADTAITVSNGGTANAATTMSFVLSEGGTKQGWFRRYRDGTAATEIGFSDGLLFTGNVTGTKVERARIDSSGNLLVGTTSAGTDKVRIASAQNTANGLGIVSTDDVAGSYIVFRNSATSAVGSITRNGTSNVAYNTSSDYRLKEGVQPMTGALAKVAALKPVTYKWKEDGSDGDGFIAHELAEVFPQAVTGKKDAVETYTDEEGNEQTRPVYQGIDTSFLVATLTAAIQEQQALITSLTQRIAALESAASDGPSNS